jgi:DNA-directed RNA polymerase subunit RPC12/RpoP
VGNRGVMKPLVRCPVCESGLIYPVRWSARDALSLIERRCPECGHRDHVRTNQLAAELWHRRNARIAYELEALADALANGLEPDLAAPRTFR